MRRGGELRKFYGRSLYSGTYNYSKFSGFSEYSVHLMIRLPTLHHLTAFQNRHFTHGKNRKYVSIGVFHISLEALILSLSYMVYKLVRKGSFPDNDVRYHSLLKSHQVFCLTHANNRRGSLHLKSEFVHDV